MIRPVPERILVGVLEVSLGGVVNQNCANLKFREQRVKPFVKKLGARIGVFDIGSEINPIRVNMITRSNGFPSSLACCNRLPSA